MNARDKKLIAIMLLFTAFGGVVYWQFFYVPSTVAKAGPAAGGPVIPAASRIQSDLLASADARGSAGRNPFSYEREVIKAPPPPPVPIALPPPLPVRDPIGRGNVQPTVAAPPVTPTAPSVPLQYIGYARDDENKMVAFLEITGTGAPAGRYNLREDDFLIGRIRVNKITVDNVEVEDLERAENASNRKTTIPISPTLAVRR